MKKKILSILLVGILIVGLTGCGANKSNSSNKITDSLNKVVKNIIDDWENNSYPNYNFNLARIEKELEKDSYNIVFIASGTKEFTANNIPKDRVYTDKIDNYDGTSFINGSMLKEETSIHYCIVYDEINDKYYNVEISYKKTTANDYEREYPYFDNAKELK